MKSISHVRSRSCEETHETLNAEDEPPKNPEADAFAVAMGVALMTNDLLPETVILPVAIGVALMLNALLAVADVFNSVADADDMMLESITASAA